MNTAQLSQHSSQQSNQPSQTSSSNQKKRMGSTKNGNLKGKLTITRLISLPVLLAMLWAAWQVGTIGLASAWHYQTLRYLQLWQKNEQLFTQHNFEKATQAINKAVALHSKHPEYLLLKAKIAEWGWYRGELSTTELGQLELIYQQAIGKRPTWPNAYADYAYYLGVTQKHITEAFSQLKLAQQYGPFTPEVFMQTLTIGFANWPQLTTKQKATTLQALQHSVKNSYITYRHALNVTRISGKLNMACSFLQAGKAQLTEAQNRQIERDFCNIRAK